MSFSLVIKWLNSLWECFSDKKLIKCWKCWIKCWEKLLEISVCSPDCKGRYWQYVYLFQELYQLRNSKNFIFERHFWEKLKWNKKTGQVPKRLKNSKIEAWAYESKYVNDLLFVINLFVDHVLHLR